MIDSICTTVATVFANGPTVNPEHQEPKRPWIGLTEEEVSEIAAQGHQRWLEFYYAIEAKLKEKNT